MFAPRFVVGAVLGDVDRRAAVLAAEGETLGQAEGDEDDRGEVADLRERRQEANGGRGDAHHGDRHEERELPAGDVADSAEERGPEGADGKAGAECGERAEEGRDVVAGGKELRPEEGGKDAVEVEVVPLDHRPGGRGADHERQAGARSRCGGWRAGQGGALSFWAEEVGMDPCAGLGQPGRSRPAGSGHLLPDRSPLALGRGERAGGWPVRSEKVAAPVIKSAPQLLSRHVATAYQPSPGPGCTAWTAGATRRRARLGYTRPP